jgi:hypothetical protein
MLDMVTIEKNPVALADLSKAMVLLHYFQVLAAKQSRSCPEHLATWRSLEGVGLRR